MFTCRPIWCEESQVCSFAPGLRAVRHDRVVRRIRFRADAGFNQSCFVRFSINCDTCQLLTDKIKIESIIGIQSDLSDTRLSYTRTSLIRVFYPKSTTPDYRV